MGTSEVDAGVRGGTSKGFRVITSKPNGGSYERDFPGDHSWFVDEAVLYVRAPGPNIYSPWVTVAAYRQWYSVTERRD